MRIHAVGREIAILAAALTILWLGGCAALNQTAETAANSLTPEDIVTGERSLNLESEPAEIARATKKTAEILAAARKADQGIDDMPQQVARLNAVFKRLVRVSHRPNLPWEIHLIDSPEVNAFTIGGGKVFVYEGLFGTLIDPTSDDEIAARACT